MGLNDTKFRHGYGKQVWPDGSRYEGQCRISPRQAVNYFN